MDKLRILPHPFYPLEAEIAGYVANTVSTASVMYSFFSGAAVVLALTLLVLNRLGAHLRVGEKLLVIWFACCGVIHIVFEGYFVINHSRMAQSSDLLGQMWKEYALADSRYMVSDTFVWWIETTVAFGIGPLCFLAAGLVITSHPLRYPIQILISFAQSYGVILYYGTATFDRYYKGVTYCRPEPYYFWFYYVTLNTIWFAIPTMIISSSFCAITRAFEACDRLLNSPQDADVAKKTDLS